MADSLVVLPMAVAADVAGAAGAAADGVGKTPVSFEGCSSFR